MKNIEQELSEGVVMIEYFSRNFDRLPALIQLSYGVELMAMMERIRPLYVAALALRGDIKKEDTNDEENHGC